MAVDPKHPMRWSAKHCWQVAWSLDRYLHRCMLDHRHSVGIVGLYVQTGAIYAHLKYHASVSTIDRVTTACWVAGAFNQKKRYGIPVDRIGEEYRNRLHKTRSKRGG